MSILLKEIEMPECCMNCPLSVSVNFGLVCCPTSTILPDSKLFDDNGDALEKPSWCPIIEVPPHGDLIDKDETMNEILKERGEDNACWFAGIVNDMPAIIHADKEGET